MTSPQQRKANQLNALKSTGPRTDTGRQRSSKNAFKHGLTKGSDFDPIQHQKSIMLATKLCEGQSLSLYPHALELAQAQIKLSLIRSLKRSQFQSLSGSLFNPLNDNAPSTPDHFHHDTTIHQNRFENVLQDVGQILSQIRKLERYERSALRCLKLARIHFLSLCK